MSYREPALIEILVEAHFREQSIQAPDFFKIVPALTDIGLTEIEFMQVLQTDASSSKLNEIQLDGSQEFFAPRVRCRNKERTQLVQLSYDLIIINKVGKYLGWADFLDMFNESFRIAIGVLERKELKSIALTTVDKFEVPTNGFSICNYLNCGPIVPNWYSDSSESIDITLGKGYVGLDGRNRQVKIKVRRGETVKFHVTSVFHNSLLEKQTIEAALEKLHEESNESFESIITDNTRALMGGWKR